jgi:hypothetical protein
MFFPVLDIESTRMDHPLEYEPFFLLSMDLSIFLTSPPPSSSPRQKTTTENVLDRQSDLPTRNVPISAESSKQGMIPCKSGDLRPSTTFCNSTGTTFERIDLQRLFHSNAFVVVSGKSHIHNNPDERLEQNRENFTTTIS